MVMSIENITIFNSIYVAAKKLIAIIWFDELWYDLTECTYCGKDNTTTARIAIAGD